MGNKRIVKFITFIIFISLFFQVIPSTPNCINGFENHVVNTTAFLSSEVLHTDVLYISRESQKSLIQIIQLRNLSVCVPQITIEDIFAVNISFQEIPLDYRKSIRQSISHYFHGSKFKENHFVI